MTKTIQEALAQLDTLNDEQWTSEGMPKVDVISTLVGETVTRQQIIDAAPKFSRQNTEIDAEDAGDEDEDDEIDETVTDPDLISDFAVKEPVDINSFVAFLQTVPAAQLVELKEALEKQKLDLQDGQTKIDEYKMRVNQALTFTKVRIKREVPDMSDLEANQAYLRSQGEIRAKKKAAVNALLQGVELSALDPRAPIDRAFARKNTRGTKRPGT